MEDKLPVHWVGEDKLPVHGVVEDGEDLEEEVWVGALKAVPHRLQDGEDNMEAAIFF